VKSAAPKTRGLDAREIVNAMEHFLRSFVSKSEQENFAGFHPLRKQIGNAVGEGAGFARSCTG